jgi:hypothetical protein
VRKRVTHGMTQSTASKRITVQYADKKVVPDSGEGHQIADGDMPVLVMQQGIPVSDTPHLLRIGARDPTALEDCRCREKSCYFDHERIPVRVVYARGCGAPGYVEHDESLVAIMKAGLFQRARSPNVPHIPISASTCSVHYVQQDRPITMGNPQGWVNHEPHAWSDGAGTTHDPRRAFTCTRRGDGAQTAPPLMLDSRANGCIALERPEGCTACVAMGRQLRFWRVSRPCNTCSGQETEGVICRIKDFSTSWRPFLRVGMDGRP